VLRTSPMRGSFKMLNADRRHKLATLRVTSL